MPTARELLEQADALMRRNRGDTSRTPANDTGPPTTGITYGPTLSPRPIAREPIAPSTEIASLAVDPTEVVDLQRWSSEAPSDVPHVELAAAPSTANVVEPDADASEVPVLTDTVAGLSAASEDDVPVLTDAVEEIDVTVMDEVGLGEPSYWELTIGETSLIGPAPDSIAVVPAPELAQPEHAPAEFPSREPLGLDQPAPEFKTTSENDVTAFADDALDAPPSGEPIAEVESAAPEGAEAARVRALAEEIGMQVLQRIDIFSETALRAQLGERMKPVVDRVSADLVAAINQHVGELLRAYIAEAIEREMESWRKDPE